MLQLGLPISSMLGGLFSRGVDSAPHSRDKWLVTGMPSPMLYANQIKIIANKTPPGTVVSSRHSLFRASHGLMLVGGGGV